MTSQVGVVRVSSPFAVRFLSFSSELCEAEDDFSAVYAAHVVQRRAVNEIELDRRQKLVENRVSGGGPVLGFSKQAINRLALYLADHLGLICGRGVFLTLTFGDESASILRAEVDALFKSLQKRASQLGFCGVRICEMQAGKRRRVKEQGLHLHLALKRSDGSPLDAGSPEVEKLISWWLAHPVVARSGALRQGQFAEPFSRGQFQERLAVYLCAELIKERQKLISAGSLIGLAMRGFRWWGKFGDVSLQRSESFSVGLHEDCFEMRSQDLPMCADCESLYASLRSAHQSADFLISRGSKGHEVKFVDESSGEVSRVPIKQCQSVLFGQRFWDAFWDAAEASEAIASARMKGASS